MPIYRLDDESFDFPDSGCIVTMKSSPAEKIRLLLSMFYGRRDVFARRSFV